MYLQPRKIDAARPRLPHHELHRGRHHEEFGDPGLLEEIQHFCGIEFPGDHAPGAVIKAEHAPTGTADVEDRHRHQRDIILGPFVPVRLLALAALHQVEEIGVRQHRALGLAGRAGGIELDRDVLPVDRHFRIVGALRVAPGRVVEPAGGSAFGGDEGAHARQLRPDLFDQLDEFRPDEQHRRPAILDDEGDLRSGQPPVHRRHHDIGFHRAQQQFEIDVAVLAEIGDALARFDAERDQRVGDAVGVLIELIEGGLASLEFEGDGVAAAVRPRAHHVGKVCRLLDVGHVAPGVWLYLR